MSDEKKDIKLLPAPPRQTIIEFAEGHFNPERTVEDVPGVGKVFIGKDLRLYRRTNGLMALIAPCDPVKDSKPGVWIDRVEWGEFPPMGQVKHLYRTFFTRFQKEVMVLIGRRWDETGWFYMIPKQMGSASEIKWEDKEGTDWFSQFGRYIGTIHIHPGESAEPSGTDRTWWATREASGLHMILGRTGKFSVTGSCAGHVIGLIQGHLDECKKEEKAVLCTSMNRKLEELLLNFPPPEPVKVKKYGGHTTGQQQFRYRDEDFTTTSTRRDREDWNDEFDFQADCEYDAVVQVGGMLLRPEDIDGLRVLILSDGTHAIVTARQWVQVALAMKDWEMQIPRSVSLEKFANATGGDEEEFGHGLHFG